MKELLSDLLKNSLKEIGIENEIITIEIPKDNKNGDYSTNIAMQLCKKLETNPRELANKIISNINDSNIERIEIAGPGFINFYVKKNYLFENINKILEQKEKYGKSNIGNNKKVNIEYVSANPTGILHLGHARGASYGDALSRLLMFAGYDVTREYYINDAGNQINNLALSIKARYEELCGFDSKVPDNGYFGPEIINIAKNIKDEYKDSMPDYTVFRQNGIDELLNNIKKDLSDYRVNFDIWSSEQSLYDRGLVEKTLETLKNKGFTYEAEGALWLKTSMYGDEKDRVLVKEDGTYTYLLPDIAYHLDKYNRGYDMLIDVLGADHHGYINRLKAAIKMMGEDPEKLDVKILQMVRLVKGKEEIKMSKRTGNVVTIRDLMDEVGTDVIRYFFIMRTLDTQLDFDIELATKTSNENPVYYVQYAHARICSILREYNKTAEELKEYSTLTSNYVYDLLVKLYEFKNIVEVSAKKYAPNLIVNYVYELSGLFHTLYSHEHILTNDELMTKERISLIAATQIVIKNSLNLLGIEAKEKM